MNRLFCTETSAAGALKITPCYSYTSRMNLMVSTLFLASQKHSANDDDYFDIFFDGVEEVFMKKKIKMKILRRFLLRNGLQ